MIRIGDLDLAEKSIEENLNIAPCDRFAAMDEVRDTPTIDPETLPIVKEMRKKLERVTAQRDAAIKDRAELADFELATCEQFCFGDRKHNIPPCEWNQFGQCKLREWREVVAENATEESEMQSDG